MAQSEDQLLKQILDRLVPAFQPSKVVLFGSRSKGTAKAIFTRRKFDFRKHMILDNFSRFCLDSQGCQRLIFTSNG